MKKKLILFAMLLCLSFAGLLQAQTPEQNKATLTSCYRLFSEQHSSSGWNNSITVPGGYIPYWPDAHKNGILHYFAAVPDARFTLGNITAEGNTVTVELECTGTFKEMYEGIEPSRKAFSYQSTQTFQFNKQGKITDGYPMPDPALFLH